MTRRGHVSAPRAGRPVLLGAVLLVAANQSLAACDEDFEACEETRTCAPGGAGDSGTEDGADVATGGTAGTGGSAASGGAGGSQADGSSGQAGGPAGSGGQAGDRADGGNDASAVQPCVDSWHDCNDDMRDGCETDTSSSANHCGACGRVCNALNTTARACSSGQCAPTCAANYDDCSSPASPQADDGCETSTNESAAHCGSCGHDCQGGLCLVGVCQRRTLATNESNPTKIAVDGSWVFWVNELEAGTIRRVPSLGSAAPPVTVKSEVWPADVATDGSYVYWVTYGRDVPAEKPMIKRMPVSQTGESTLHMGTFPADSFYALALDSVSVYYVNYGATSISKVPLGGGGPTLVTSAAGFAMLIDLDATHVYFATNGGRVSRVTQSGGTTENVSTTGARRFAVYSGMLYFGAVGGGVLRVPVAGGTETPVANTSRDVTAIAVDESGVYYATGAGDLQHVPHAGGTPTPIMTSMKKPSDIATDAVSIYWLDAGDTGSSGAVYKIAK